MEQLNNKKSFGERLYERSPAAYKKFDEEQKPVAYPLKRFLQIPDRDGWEHSATLIQELKDMYDPLKTPERNLDLLADMLGFRFPIATVPDGQGGEELIALTTDEKRQLLSLLPSLYRFKGTSRVFTYLGRNVFGGETDVSAEWIPRSQSSNGYHTISLNVTVDDNVQDVGAKVARYKMFAERFRPANNKLNVSLRVIYYDDYMRSQVPESVIDALTDYIAETYASGSIVESSLESLFMVEEETYNKDSIIDESVETTREWTSETYAVPSVLDALVDTVIAIGTRLTLNSSANRLTRGFRATKPTRETVRNEI